MPTDQYHRKPLPAIDPLALSIVGVRSASRPNRHSERWSAVSRARLLAQLPAMSPARLAEYVGRVEDNTGVLVTELEVRQC